MKKLQKIALVVVLALILLFMLVEGYFLKNKSAGVDKEAGVSISQLSNATLPDFIFSSNQPFLLKDGKYTQYGDQGEPGVSIELDSATSTYAYGDLNGDGLADIAAVFDVTTGGTGYFRYLTVFTNDDGMPRYATSTELGDRVKINKISINGGIISADIVTQGPTDPMCCASLPETLKYKLSGNMLVEVNQ